MSHFMFRRTSMLVACVAGAGLLTLVASNPAQAAVGTQVLLQTWTPQQPEVQGLATAMRSPTLVSDTLAQFWRSGGRIGACKAIAQALGGAKPRVYDMDCRLSDQVDVQASSSANGQVQLSLFVPGNVLLAKAAIDVIPDPRFSIDFDLRVDLTLKVGNDTKQPLSVVRAQARVTNVHADSQNLIADMAKAVTGIVSFVGGPDFQREAEMALESRNIDFRGQLNAMMPAINAQLQLPATLPGHVRVGVWSRPDLIIVAYAPLLEAIGGGAMEGTVRWDAAVFEVSSCADLQFAATVQVGPRPLTNPEGALGSAPLRTVGTVREMQHAPGSCDYRLEGLGSGMPHRLEVDARSAARALRQKSGFWTMAGAWPEGWDGKTVTPQPLAPARNYLIQGGQVKSAVRARASMPLATAPIRPGASDGPVGDPQAKSPTVTSIPWGAGNASTSSLTPASKRSTIAAPLASPANRPAAAVEAPSTIPR